MERQHQFNEGNRTLTYTFAPLFIYAQLLDGYFRRFAIL